MIPVSLRACSNAFTDSTGIDWSWSPKIPKTGHLILESSFASFTGGKYLSSHPRYYFCLSEMV